MPLSDPNAELVAAGLKQAKNWIDAVGLKKDRVFTSLEITVPAGLQLRFLVKESLRDALPRVDPSTRYIGLENRLFYKFTGSIGAMPSAVSMRMSGFWGISDYTWQNGLVWASNQQIYMSATVGGELKNDDLATIALASSATDGVVPSLYRSARDFLVTYLTTFHGKVAVIHDEASYLLLRVNNAKNTILGTKNRWEDVDINFIIAATSQGARLLCIVDGRWAPGILPPKSTEDFRDMEPQYSKNLGDFAGQLLVRLKDDLLKPKDDKKP